LSDTKLSEWKKRTIISLGNWSAPIYPGLDPRNELDFKTMLEGFAMNSCSNHKDRFRGYPTRFALFESKLWRFHFPDLHEIRGISWSSRSRFLTDQRFPARRLEVPWSLREFSVFASPTNSHDTILDRLAKAAQQHRDL
jgi:hypothetical protein